MRGNIRHEVKGVQVRCMANECWLDVLKCCLNALVMKSGYVLLTEIRQYFSSLQDTLQSKFHIFSARKKNIGLTNDTEGLKPTTFTEDKGLQSIRSTINKALRSRQLNEDKGLFNKTFYLGPLRSTTRPFTDRLQRTISKIRSHVDLALTDLGLTKKIREVCRRIINQYKINDNTIAYQTISYFLVLFLTVADDR
jgi:hypothetical protein